MRKELNISKIKRRPLERARNLPLHSFEELSLLQESKKLFAEHRKKIMLHSTGESTSLLDLFNRDFVEFVKWTGTGYAPVEWQHQATHQLVATVWNKEPTPNCPKGLFALSVVANPLKPKLAATTMTIKRVIPKGAPVYKLTGKLNGKRGVLLWLVKATGASFHRRLITKMNVDECDLLYRNIHRADLHLKFYEE